MAATKKSTKSGFSADERAAMKAAAAERKASQKQQDLDRALVEAIGKLPDDERKIAEKLDAIVREHAPMLASKTYYGMPGWARDGKVCVSCSPRASSGCATAQSGSSRSRIWTMATCGRPRSRSSRSGLQRRRESKTS